MIGMREILRHFSNVSVNDVVGMRAPFLKPGRNTQYKVSKTSSMLLSSLPLTDICIPLSITTRKRKKKTETRFLAKRANNNYYFVYCRQMNFVKYFH